jgi:hypothetical protein
MAEPHDPQLSQHYRELEPLEPPAELDHTILAAGRHAASRRKRWYYSLAAAAVLVFAVALTLHIEREGPDSGSASQDSTTQLRLSRELRGEIKPAQPLADSKPAEVAPPAAADRAGAAPASPPPESRVTSPSRARRADAVTARQANTAEAPAPAPAPPPEPAIQLRRETAIAPQYAPPSPQAQGRVRSAAPATARESPEKWLERIIELRRADRHAEADKQLAAFRERYPNYKLPEAALKPEK